MSFKLEAEVRTDAGKGGSRRLRRAGRLPAIVYSAGKEPMSVHVEPREFVKAVRGPLRRNALIELNVKGGETRQVMVKDIQIDLIRREPIHVDFHAVDMKSPVEVMVPFTTFGRSKAVVLGAKLNIVRRAIKVQVLPGQVPEKLEVDVTNLEPGPFRAKDVPMPEGCSLVEDGHTTVLTISRPRGEGAKD